MISIITAAAGSVWAWLMPWIVKRGAIIGVAAAVLAVWLGNNAIQRAEGRSQVVQASKQAGAKRNEEVRRIRARIEPSTAWSRLQREYADRD